MKYQPLNDLIDPDVPPEDAPPPESEQEDPDAPNDAYVIGERFNTVQAPDAKEAAVDESRPRPWVKPAAILLAVLFVGLTGWNISRLVSGPAAAPSPTPFQMKQALYLGVMKIEAYRRMHGVTPDTLQDADLPNPPYSYRRVSSTQYSVGIDGNGSRLEYDSGIPMERFFGAPRDMLAMGESK